MAEIREVKGSWACTTEVGEMPLAKGLRLTVGAAAIGQEADVVCEVVEWQYRVGKQEGGSTPATLEITVQAVEEPGTMELIGARLEEWFDGLSGETRFFAPIWAAGMMLVACGIVGWTLYVQPDHGLAIVGRHVRTAGGYLILVLFVAVLPWRMGIYRGRSSFGKSFSSALMTMTGVVAWSCWQVFSAYPATGFDWDKDSDCVTYARTLGSTLSKSYWPIVLAALPWISLSAKVFGLETAGKVSEGLEKLAKKKEKE